MWVLPSRRSHLIERVFSVAPPTEPGIIVIDAKDRPAYEQYKLPWPLHIVENCKYYRDKVNAAFKDFPDERYYGILGDDMVPETPGWDVFLGAKAGNKNIAVSSQVPITDRIGTGALGGDLVRACGWLCCPAVHHFYSDDAVELIGAEFNCLTWFKDIHIRHHHFSVGLSAFDTFYQSRSDQNDGAAFGDWKKNEWPKLRQALAPLYRN